MPDWFYQPTSVENVFAFALTCGLLVLMAFAIRRYVVEMSRKREDERLGFDVKLNSGGMPEEQKKENDHG